MREQVPCGWHSLSERFEQAVNVGWQPSRPSRPASAARSDQNFPRREKARATQTGHHTSANPCSDYVTWSEQKCIENQAPQHLRNVLRIITETGLRVYTELMRMKKDQVDLPNPVVWIPDSKPPNGIAEVPLTQLAMEALRDQMTIAGEGPFLFPSESKPTGHQKTLKTAWRKTLRRAKNPYFRIYDLRSTYATRLSAGGVADEWVTQMLRQGEAQVFKEVFPDGTPDEERSLAEAEPPGERHGIANGYSHGPMTSYGTV